MRNLPIMILVPVLAVCVLLGMRRSARVAPSSLPNASVGGAETKSVANLIPSCSGDSSDSFSGRALPQGSQKPHSVTLSWNASVPVSNSPKDAIRGYHVYRSQTSQAYVDRDKINSSPLIGTRCLDTAVQPRATYYYVVKAVAESGAESVVSKEIKAVIPFP